MLKEGRKEERKKTFWKKEGSRIDSSTHGVDGFFVLGGLGFVSLLAHVRLHLDALQARLDVLQQEEESTNAWTGIRRRITFQKSATPTATRTSHAVRRFFRADSLSAPARRRNRFFLSFFLSFFVLNFILKITLVKIEKRRKHNLTWLLIELSML